MTFFTKISVFSVFLFFFLGHYAQHVCVCILPLAGIAVVAWVLQLSSRNTFLSVKALEVSFLLCLLRKGIIKEQFVWFWCVLGQELWEKPALLGGEG